MNKRRAGTPLPALLNQMISGNKIILPWGPDQRRSGTRLPAKLFCSVSLLCRQRMGSCIGAYSQTWFESPFRSTRDLDLLGFGDSASDATLDIFREICAIQVEDGVEFDAAAWAVSRIREELEYGGLRVLRRHARRHDPAASWPSIAPPRTLATLSRTCLFQA